MPLVFEHFQGVNPAIRECSLRLRLFCLQPKQTQQDHDKPLETGQRRLYFTRAVR
jgi:hypothetical protein